MGQANINLNLNINCQQCSQQHLNLTLQNRQQMETIITNTKSYKNRKVRNRVKSILQPKQNILKKDTLNTLQKTQTQNNKQILEKQKLRYQKIKYIIKHTKSKSTTKQQNNQENQQQYHSNQHILKFHNYGNLSSKSKNKQKQQLNQYPILPFSHKYQSLKENNHTLQSQYGIITIVGNISEHRQIQVRSQITTLGTFQSQNRLKRFKNSEQDNYKMYLKYVNSNLYIKDSGIGLGVFIYKQKYSIQKLLLKNIDSVLLIKWDANFLILQNQSMNQIIWTFKNNNESDRGSFKVQELQNLNNQIKIKDLIILSDKLTKKKFIRHNKKQVKIFIQCQQFQQVKERDILRCGLTFYKIQCIQGYLDTSRLVKKY